MLSIFFFVRELISEHHLSITELSSRKADNATFIGYVTSQYQHHTEPVTRDDSQISFLMLPVLLHHLFFSLWEPKTYCSEYSSYKNKMSSPRRRIETDVMKLWVQVVFGTTGIVNIANLPYDPTINTPPPIASHDVQYPLTWALLYRLMSDYEVTLVNDNMQEFYVRFHGPSDSKSLESVCPSHILAFICNWVIWASPDRSLLTMIFPLHDI